MIKAVRDLLDYVRRRVVDGPSQHRGLALVGHAGCGGRWVQSRTPCPLPGRACLDGGAHDVVTCDTCGECIDLTYRLDPRGEWVP